jgi:hypothetical protein
VFFLSIPYVTAQGFIAFCFRNLPTKSFEGIDTVTTLMLIESKISEFPGTIFQHMPNVEVVRIERTFIETVSPADFKVSTDFIRGISFALQEDDVILLEK